MIIKPRCIYFNKSCEVSESLDKTRTFIKVNTFYLDLSFEAALHRDHHIGQIPTFLSYFGAYNSHSLFGHKNTL